MPIPVLISVPYAYQSISISIGMPMPIPMPISAPINVCPITPLSHPYHCQSLPYANQVRVCVYVCDLLAEMSILNFESKFQS